MRESLVIHPRTNMEFPRKSIARFDIDSRCGNAGWVGSRRYSRRLYLFDSPKLLLPTGLPVALLARPCPSRLLLVLLVQLMQIQNRIGINHMQPSNLPLDSDSFTKPTPSMVHIKSIHIYREARITVLFLYIYVHRYVIQVFYSQSKGPKWPYDAKQPKKNLSCTSKKF